MAGLRPVSIKMKKQSRHAKALSVAVFSQMSAASAHKK